MTAHRYRLDPPAKLVARDGSIVGVLTSVTLDLYGPDGAGGKGAAVGEQTTLLGEPPREGGAGETKFDPIPEVWQHYVAVMAPRTTGLDAQARALIREALKVASLSECKRAIDGCKASAFHMGDNDRHKKYNRLSQILKGKRGIRTTREQIDLFLDIAEKVGLPSGVTSADPAKVNQAKRDVIAAVDSPGDVHAQERGETAKAWLESLGFKIGTNPETGRPTFRVSE